MVKKLKSKISIKKIGFVGVIVLAIVALTPLLLLFAEIEVPIIGKAYADALGILQSPTNQFEIPFPPLKEGEKIPTEEEFIKAVINDTLDESKFPMLTDEELDQIEKAMNMTETSNDPPIKQIIDKIFEPDTIKLVVNVAKIDSNLQRFNETISSDIPLASLFVEDTTNIDFRNGLIEISLDLKTIPETQINADGKFNIEINESKFFAEDIILKASGLTDENGIIELSFEPSPEILSKLVTFDFGKNFDMFPNEQITKISFIINSLEIMIEEKTFGLTDEEVFSVDIFRDDFKILITDTEGNQIKAYPQDSILTITSNPSKLYIICSKRTQCPTSGFTRACHTLWKTVPAVSLGSIKVFDESGEIVATGGGGSFGSTGLVLNTKLFRNNNYTIDHSVIDKPRSLDPFEILTPKTQQNFDYKVWTSVEYQQGGVQTGRSGLCTITTTYKIPIEGTEFITSNFPK